MKTLPEEKKIVKKLDANQQLRMLLEKLAGHKVFGRCRGSFNDFPFENMLEAGQPPSPSAALGAFNRWAGSRRVMLDMLARFMRDGLHVAFGELMRALCEPDYVMTGETVPVEKTRSGVLVMVDPSNIFLLLRWMYTSKYEDGYNWVRNGRVPEERNPCGSLTPQLLKVFPGLYERFKGREESREICLTALVLGAVSNLLDRLRANLGRRDMMVMRPDYDRTGLWYYGYPIGAFVKGRTQKEVLRLFERDEQKRIATWQFNYPETDEPFFYSDSTGRHHPRLIGVHLESEHATWRRQWPSYASKGVACGHGAVILDKEKLGEAVGGQKNYHFSPYESLRGPNPGLCRGDLTSRRFVIGFDCVD